MTEEGASNKKTGSVFSILVARDLLPMSHCRLQLSKAAGAPEHSYACDYRTPGFDRVAGRQTHLLCNHPCIDVFGSLRSVLY